MKQFILLILFIVISQLSFGQALQIEWQQCYGGPGFDGGTSAEQLPDGSYIILGGNSASGGDVSNNHGKGDFWLIKTDAFGNLIWEKSLGGSEVESAKKLLLSPDGGYVLFGETFSNDGDVSGNHGGLDYWLVKTDSLGNILWQNCIGSSVNDYASGMEMDSTGNIYVIGFSHGTDGDISSNNGHADYWFVKVSPEGNILWDKNLGGSWPDWGKCLALTNDGGMIVGGLTESNDIDVSCNETLGQVQAWVVKLDSLNNIEWQKCYGGSYTENVIRIKQTDDKGYILLCLTNSNDGDVTGFHGQPGSPYNFDIWVVRLDSVGELEWQRSLGGTEMESPRFIKVTANGDYLIGGTTDSNDGDVSGNHSLDERSDLWLVKLSSDGELLYQQCFGGEWDDAIKDLVQIANGNFLIISSIWTSNNTGDIDCEHKGEGDMWLFEVKDSTVGIDETVENTVGVEVYPNPASDFVTFACTLPPGTTEGSIEIHNLTGQRVAAIPLNQAEDKVLFDTGKLPPGIYFYTLKTARAATTRKLVITR